MTDISLFIYKIVLFIKMEKRCKPNQGDVSPGDGRCLQITQGKKLLRLFPSCSNSTLWRNAFEDYKHQAACFTDHILVAAFTSTLTTYFDVTFYLCNNNCLEVPCACFTDMDFVLYELMGSLLFHPLNRINNRNKEEIERGYRKRRMVGE